LARYDGRAATPHPRWSCFLVAGEGEAEDEELGEDALDMGDWSRGLDCQVLQPRAEVELTSLY